MAVSSKNSVVLVDVAATPVALTEVRDWTLNTQRGTIDASVLSTEWKRYLVGQISATGSMKLFFDPADSTAEAAIETAMFSGASMTIYFRPEGTGSGKRQFKVPAYITEWSLAGATEDAVGVDVSFSANAAVDPADQAT